MRLLALADAAAGRPISHWCVDLGPAYFLGGRRLTAAIPRVYFTRRILASTVFARFMPEVHRLIVAGKVPDLEKNIVPDGTAPGVASPAIGGLFWSDRTTESMRLMLQLAYATAAFFDTHPISRLGHYDHKTRNCTWSSKGVKRLLGRAPWRGGLTFRVQQKFWEAGLGFGVFGPPPATARQYALVNALTGATNNADLTALTNAERAGEVDGIIRAQLSTTPSAGLFGAQFGLFGRATGKQYVGQVHISTNGTAVQEGSQEVSYCGRYLNPAVSFDRAINGLPDPGSCRGGGFLYRYLPASRSILMGNGGHEWNATIADYYMMLAAAMVSWLSELPDTPLRRHLELVGEAITRLAMTRVLALSGAVLHEMAHDDELCGSDHCADGAGSSTNGWRALIDPSKGFDCGHSLPGFLWHQFMTGYLGLPYIRGAATPHPSPWDNPIDVADPRGSISGYCGCSGGTWRSELAAHGSPTFNRRAAIKGVALRSPCPAGGVTAVHLDPWRKRSQVSVHWSMSPGCATSPGMVTGGLSFFDGTRLVASS